MKYTKKYLCKLIKKIFIYFVLFTMLFSESPIIAAQKTGDEMLAEISERTTELLGDDIPNAQDDDYAAYTYIEGEQTVDTEGDDDDFEDTITGKIITAIIQIVAIIGDAADQTMAYIMYGTGTWKSYNVLIKEPEVEAEGAAQIDMGAMRKKVQYPKIVYSPEEIFTGKNPVSNKKIALLDIDFINRSKRSDYTSSDGFEDRNILKQNIAS